MSNLAKKITEQAFEREELDKLLLGEKPYKYVPKYSPAIDTDLALLIENGFYAIAPQELVRFSHDLSRALMKLAKDYIGIVPVASIIMLESHGRKENQSPLMFDLLPIARQLEKTICKYSKKLKQDKSGYGATWDNGLYDEVRNKAEITVEFNGPDFFGLDSAK